VKKEENEMDPIKWVGIGCLLGGIFLLIGYGMHLLLARSIPTIVSIALSTIVVGIIILLVSLSFERYKESKGEEEREIREEIKKEVNK
jgi:hypothetical protein